jgi:probable rRNA maturation factor
MIKVLVFKQSNYPVSATKIKKELSGFLGSHGIESDAEVSVSLVSEKTMLEVSNKYLKDDLIHDVLSFPSMEVKGEFIQPPDSKMQLGEIIVCYQMAYEQAKEEGMSIEQKTIDLILHGALHLLGIHHK